MITTLQAVPAKQGIHTVKQPDGTTLRIELHGDEHFHFTTTEDGYLIKQNGQGVYEYAEFTVERVINSIGVKAYSLDQRAAQPLPKRAIKAAEALRKVDASYWSKGSKRLTLDKAQRAPKAVGTPMLASRGLVLLVEFADKRMQAETTQSSMNDMLNGSNYTYDDATGSVRKYFSDQSNGAYVPEFGVFGPITLSRDMAYYGGNDNYGDDLRPAEMVNEACSIANAKFGVDFSQYDSDGDGNVDFVFVIYAGYAEAQGASENTIWPHQWSLESAGIPLEERIYDGKYVSGYACSSELQGYSGTTRAGIGTFCHEFSHVLGLPDYYDTDYAEGVDNTSKIPDVWSLMSGGSYNNNSKTPPNYSAYDKYYMGWITPTVLNTSRSVSLPADGRTCYAITADGTLSGATDAKDVWYLENRQQTGWDAYLPAHGMLVTKVHYNQAVWSMNTVNNGTPMCYDIIGADGSGLGRNNASVTFPGLKNIRSFTPVGRYSLKNITETSEVISFQVVEDVTAADPADNVVFYDSFENPDEWIVNDPSTTSCYAEYGGILIEYFSNLAAPGGNTYLISSYDEYAARDAWAVSTRSVALEAGKEYMLSAYVYAYGIDDVFDKIQFTIGNSSNIANQTEVVCELHEKYRPWTIVSAKFTPTTSGVYHFGIHHCTAEKNVNVVAIDELTITAVADVPEQATDDVLVYDSFEDDAFWITTDPSTTCRFASYGGIFVNRFSNIPAAGGNYYLISGYDNSAARDAWAIMRNGLSLEAGKEYTISAYVFAWGNNNFADQIQFTVGTSSAISSQTEVILDLHERYDPWTLVTAKFTPTTDGLYHFGIHHCTQALGVNDIAVDEFKISKVASAITALENAETSTLVARKVLKNGTLYIIKPNGETYTIDGRRIR